MKIENQFSFSVACETSKTSRFPTFSEGKEMIQWSEMR